MVLTLQHFIIIATSIAVISLLNNFYFSREGLENRTGKLTKLRQYHRENIIRPLRKQTQHVRDSLLHMYRRHANYLG